MIPKNCFKSGPIGFFFLYFRCDKGLVGTRETGGSFFAEHVNPEEWWKRTGEDKKQELRRVICIS